MILIDIITKYLSTYMPYPRKTWQRKTDTRSDRKQYLPRHSLEAGNDQENDKQYRKKILGPRIGTNFVTLVFPQYWSKVNKNRKNLLNC